jgi:hypothetical protein
MPSTERIKGYSANHANNGQDAGQSGQQPLSLRFKFSVIQLKCAAKQHFVFRDYYWLSSLG